MVEPVVEIGIVAFVLDQTASMSDGGAVTLEKAADLGQAHPAADMGEIHCHLPGKCRPGGASRRCAKFLDADLKYRGNR